MMVSPKAAQAAGDKFGAKPVCSGPFRFVERVAQDRIVLERYPNYWNKAKRPLSTRSSTLPILGLDGAPGQLAAGPPRPHRAGRAVGHRGLKKDKNPKVASIIEIGYQGITINVGKSDQAQKNPLGQGCAGSGGARSWRSTAMRSSRSPWTTRRSAGNQRVALTNT